MAFEDTVMTRSEPSGLGRATRLHGLLALMLAACVAIMAIAAAVALLDNAVRPSAIGSTSQETDTAFAGSDA
jgi:hypothetical protein